MTIFTDASTISSKTTPSSVDIVASVDSSTLTSITTIISDDRGPFTEIGTPASITQVPVGEFEYVHPAGYWGLFDNDNGAI